MSADKNYYCYSYRLFHFLLAFGEKCLGSRVNSCSKKRYWVFEKSQRVDEIIELYNAIKYELS